MTAAVVRRCSGQDWPAVRRLSIKLAMGLPLVVDVDLNEVLATPHPYWQRFVQTCAMAPDQALFLAEVTDRCVGMGHVRVELAEARLGMLYVDGEARGRGIGSALVQAQEAWALGSGTSNLVCHISDASAAWSLAERLGWQLTGEVFYTKHGFTEHKWTKSAP